MTKKLSRRVLAEYFVQSLTNGDSKQQITDQLAAYLVETRRTSESGLIVRDIEALLAENGTVVGTITTAFSLDRATKQAIEQTIKQQTTAKTVSLSEAIDPTVIGGYRVTLPGKEIDQTVATQLTTLKTQFRKG